MAGSDEVANPINSLRGAVLVGRGSPLSCERLLLLPDISIHADTPPTQAMHLSINVYSYQAPPAVSVLETLKKEVGDGPSLCLEEGTGK